MTEDIEKKYIQFASKVSFFEFIQKEFKTSDLDIDALKNEISVLKEKTSWNIDELSDFVRNYPKSFLIFQEIAQLLRFTNAQLIHFVFDVERLNSLNLQSLLEYLIFNIKYDEELRGLYLKLLNNRISYDEFISNIGQYDKQYLIALFKQSVSKYIDKIVKDFNLLEKRVKKSEFADITIRFSNYLLHNLALNDTLKGINIEDFLRHKKVPIDTKSIHGNFAKIKIIKILEKNGFRNIDSLLNEKKINVLNHNLSNQLNLSEFGDSPLFCTERYVEGIIKPKDKKPKKFDLIILKDLSPKYLFEINFYSTEGTKIGINQNEYIDLNSFINEKFKDLEFYWITDGNYWLTLQGKNRYKNLLKTFKEIYNINLFAEEIDKFK